MPKLIEWLQECRIQTPDRFAGIYAFNWIIDQGLHPAHLEGVIDAHHLSALLSCSRVRGRIRAWLLQRLEISEAFTFDFQKPASRLMLIDVGLVHRLFFYAGAGLVSERVAHIISKNERAALEQKLGENIYLFALKRAPFLKNLTPALPVLKNPTEDLFQDMLHAARQCFECCYGSEPHAFTQRLRLRFPTHIPWNFEQAYLPELRNQCWVYMHRILTRDIAPHTASCFE